MRSPEGTAFKLLLGRSLDAEVIRLITPHFLGKLLEWAGGSVARRSKYVQVQIILSKRFQHGRR
ncbi:hypothetical protein COMA2_70018 [Candidatus Nitrospira nitrificans]|uniref:Uncharacterized protein n=1 Tax=Candidatus Nitrospira nitrificans TaxID=1742973 RepID=A0A0S4LT92_9BACT|nr:hypothetical protein COMA2_70018 [Candidatus Nitrospira nitrificans]